MTTLGARALEVYARAAGTLAKRYEAIDPAAIYAPLAELLPPPCRMADIGAGTGRDAVWFAGRGFDVTAVEPTEGLRRVGEARALPGVVWRDASLPGLDGIEGPFGFIVVNAVWHHLDAEERDAALARLAGLMAPGGRLLVSLRHGPDLPGHPVDRLDPDAETARAARAGLELAGRHAADSVQDVNRGAGVTWTWLALTRPEGGTR